MNKNKINLLLSFLGIIFGVLISDFWGNNFYIIGAGLFAGGCFGWFFCKIISAIATFFVEICKKASGAITGFLKTTTEVKITIKNWLGTAKENMAMTIMVFAIIIYFSIICLGIKYFWSKASWPDALIFSSFSINWLIFIFGRKGLLFKIMEKYKQNNLKFFILILFCLLRTSFLFYLIMILSAGYFFVLGTAYVVFSFLLVGYAMFVVAVYKMATIKFRHRVVPMAGFATTIFWAYLLKPFVSDLRLLWLVAFSCNMILGLTIWGLNSTILWWFHNTKKGRYYKEIIGESEYINEYLDSLLKPFSGWIFRNFRYKELRKTIFGN